MSGLKRYIPELVFATLITVLAWVGVWRYERWEINVLTSDTRGYYAYLPAVFIQNDLSFQSTLEVEEERFDNLHGFTHLYQESDGDWFNKYFPGWALINVPGFLIAWLVEVIFFGGASGYETSFILAFHITSLLVALLGFAFLRKLLQERYPSINATWIVFLVFFATNLSYYAALKPGMNHIQSFAAITVLLFSLHRWRMDRKKVWWWVWTLLFGIVIALRPTNVIVLLVAPFILGKKGVTSILEKRVPLLIQSWPFLVPIGIWFTLNLLQTGDLLIWSYSNEGFYWFDPEFMEVLIGFRKGWWLYHPLIFLAFIGLIPLWKKDRWSTAFLIGFWMIEVYLVSAWWNWYYGGGFGHRAFVDHYALIGIMLACVFEAFSVRRLRPALTGLSLLLVAFNLYQGFQTLTRILPGDHVSKETYLASLVEFKPERIPRFHNQADIHPYGKKVEHFERNAAQELPQKSDEVFLFTRDINLPHDHSKGSWFFTIDAQLAHLGEACDRSAVFVVVETYFQGERISYLTESIYTDLDRPPREPIAVSYSLDPAPQQIDRVRFYLWNPHQCPIEWQAFEVSAQRYEGKSNFRK